MIDTKTMIHAMELRVRIAKRNHQAFVDLPFEMVGNVIALLKEQEALIHFLEHQREKGHWIFGDTNGHSWMKCSQCLVSQDGQTSCYLFCPCCGADMSEGR